MTYHISKVIDNVLASFKECRFHSFALWLDDTPTFDYFEDHSLPKNLPLLDVAKKWDIKIYTYGDYFGYLGIYASDDNTIHLWTPSRVVFFHELVHAAYLRANLRKGRKDEPREEIVSYVASLVLHRIVCKRKSKYEKTVYHKVIIQAKRLKLTPLQAIEQLRPEIETVVSLILSERQ